MPDLLSTRLFSFILISIIFLILGIFRQTNKDLSGLTEWCIYPLFISLEVFLSLFPEMRFEALYVNIGNGLTVFAYLALAIGIAKFCHLKIDNKYIVLSVVGFLLLSFIAYQNIIPQEARVWISIIFIFLALGVSIKILLSKETHIVGVEKIFLIIWLIVHLISFIFWMYSVLVYADSMGQAFVSWTYLAMNLSHVMIMMGLMTLIIARRRFQLKLALENEELNSRIKSQFLTNMSHELRTPLNSIIGFSESLIKGVSGKLNKQQDEYVNYILGGGEMLLAQINELLMLSKIEETQSDIDLYSLNIGGLIEQTIPLMESITSINNIDVTLEIDKSNKWVVTANKVKTQQILLNLISNAAKFGKKGGHIWISFESQDDDLLKVIVRDDGIGIHENHVQNVFRRFNRAGQENSNIEGSGVGLAITQSLVHKMGGEIGCTSEFGKGSTFWFTLPVAEENKK